MRRGPGAHNISWAEWDSPSSADDRTSDPHRTMLRHQLPFASLLALALFGLLSAAGQDTGTPDAASGAADTQDSGWTLVAILTIALT